MLQTVVLFVDTNFLLQCRLPNELPWAEVIDAGVIQLCVPRPVQTEIDRLKGDGNSRRARKARKIAAIFRELVRNPDRQKVVLENHPRVVWRLPPALDPHRERPASLDMTLMDDRIVEATLAYATSFPGDDVRLLSHDTGPQLTASDLGLKIVQVPDEWLLEPEPDTASKAVTDLQKRLAVLEGLKPALALSVLNWSREQGPLTLQCIDYLPLSANEVERFAANIELRNPLKTRPPVSGTLAMTSLGIISEERLSQYRYDYKNWQSELRRALAKIPEYLLKIDQSMVVRVDLSNDGGAPAERVIVEFEADGFLLYPPVSRQSLTGSQEWPRLKLPKVPKPPRSILEDGFGASGHSMFDSIRLPQIRHHDRHKFYWHPDRPDEPKKSWRFESDEFRHRLSPERFAIRIIPIDGMTRGAINVRVSAANQADPIILEVPIRINHVAAESKSAFQAYIFNRDEGADHEE